MSTGTVTIRNEDILLQPEALPSASQVRKSLSELTDSELAQRFLDGEQRAFGELVGRYDQRLLNFVYRTVGDRERAQDLVQETFVRVYRHLHRFDQNRKFSTWIYTIAGNLAKNELRNRSRNPLVLFQTIRKNWEADHRPLEWEDERSMPDDLFRKRHLREKVEEAVQHLPEHHRIVFVLREIEGRSYEEIAEITGTNLGTVKSRLNRARNNFARIIAPMVD
jgi:RNA polymerase sigma-70 factor (ECF subfamily)